MLSGNEFHIWGPSILRLLLPIAPVLWLSTNRLGFYDLYMDTDEISLIKLGFCLFNV